MLAPLVWNRTFRGSTSEVVATEKWLDRIVSEQRLSAEMAFALKICAEELLTNIVKHGAKSSPNIDLTLTICTDRVELVVEDDGQPFDVAAARTSPISRPLAEVEPGGLGIHLIHRFADGLDYEKSGLGNRVRATFRLPEKGGPKT
jgi:serine/threonine-protein kinase RsbW